MSHDTVPAALADAIVLDEEGKEVRLGDTWTQKPVVLAFVRHFGCMFCREHVNELNKHADEMKAVGAELVVVGSGTPNFVRGFRELVKFKGPVYCDPKLGAYQAAHLKNNRWLNLHPLNLINLARAVGRGNCQGRMQGVDGQQGGVLVIFPPDRVAFWHVSARAGDNASPSRVLAALRSGARAKAA